MTEGERMVWAAAYASKLTDAMRSPPPAAMQDLAYYRRWEEGVVNGAVEHASKCVDRMRAALPRIEEGEGADAPMAVRLREMMDGKP